MQLVRIEFEVLPREWEKVLCLIKLAIHSLYLVNISHKTDKGYKLVSRCSSDIFGFNYFLLIRGRCELFFLYDRKKCNKKYIMEEWQKLGFRVRKNSCTIVDKNTSDISLDNIKIVGEWWLRYEDGTTIGQYAGSIPRLKGAEVFEKICSDHLVRNKNVYKLDFYAVPYPVAISYPLSIYMKEFPKLSSLRTHDYPNNDRNLWSDQDLIEAFRLKPLMRVQIHGYNLELFGKMENLRKKFTEISPLFYALFASKTPELNDLVKRFPKELFRRFYLKYL